MQLFIGNLFSLEVRLLLSRVHLRDIRGQERREPLVGRSIERLDRHWSLPPSSRFFSVNHLCVRRLVAYGRRAVGRRRLLRRRHAIDPHSAHASGRLERRWHRVGLCLPRLSRERRRASHRNRHRQHEQKLPGHHNLQQDITRHASRERHGFLVLRYRADAVPSLSVTTSWPTIGCKYRQDMALGTNRDFRVRSTPSRPTDTQRPSRETTTASDQSPKLMPIMRAAITTSWLGSTRLTSFSTSSMGMVTRCGDCSATMCPQRLSAIA